MLQKCRRKARFVHGMCAAVSSFEIDKILTRKIEQLKTLK
jgi:hypothetical protein